MEDEPKVAVLMGSDSDLPVMQGTIQVLENLEVPFSAHVMSAHRSPEKVRTFAMEAESKGLEVIIAGAGGAAHLAGVLAASTALPVIGVPIPTDRMGGMDSLFSTIQMPSGVPVAAVGLGKSGAKNAGVLAAQIVSVGDSDLRERLREYRQTQADEVSEKDERLSEWLEQRRKAQQSQS